MTKEEAAWEYASKECEKAAFIAGAEWQKKQMLEKAIKGQVFGATDVKALYEGKVYIVSNLIQDTDYNLHSNDKVRITIVK